MPAYPTSLPDFQRLFATEEACQDYLFNLRWPEGFVCPECEETEFYWHRPRKLVKCAGCGQQVYVAAGSILHRSHTPLQTWFYATFLVTTMTPGISAVQLQHQLGIKTYETAFQILHKIRAAMINPDREPLEGEVEADETYVAGVQHEGKGGRNTEVRTLVLGVVEVRTSKRSGKRVAGRVRLRAAEKADGPCINAFFRDHVDRGAKVLTDGWPGYSGLRKLGYKHKAVVVGDDPARASQALPVIHREFGNLKTWLLGTHHGRVERQHLQAYLNEFCFRHNRRFWRFSAFQRVLQLGLGGKSPTYDELYAADEYGRNVHLSDAISAGRIRKR